MPSVSSISLLSEFEPASEMKFLIFYMLLTFVVATSVGLVPEFTFIPSCLSIACNFEWNNCAPSIKSCLCGVVPIVLPLTMGGG